MAQAMLEEIRREIENVYNPLNKLKSIAKIESILANKNAKKYIIQKFSFKDNGVKTYSTILHWIICDVNSSRSTANDSYLKIVRLLIATNPEILQIPEPEKNDLPLHACIRSGKDWLLPQLINADNINKPNMEGKTALHLVCELDKAGPELDCRARAKMLDALLKINTLDVHCHSRQLVQTPLYTSLSLPYDRIDIITKLIKRKADVRILVTDNSKKLTAMHQAAKMGLYEELKLLIRSCSTCHLLDSEDETPLHYAIRQYQLLLDFSKPVSNDQRSDSNSDTSENSSSDSQSDDDSSRSESTHSSNISKQLEEIRDVIYLLLKQNSIQISFKNKTGKEALDLTTDQEIKDILIRRKRCLEYLEKSKKNNGEVVWVKSLNFKYERRPSHNSPVPSSTESNHFHLKESENATRARNGNTAAAGLTFILKREGSEVESLDSIRLEWIEFTAEMNLSVKDTKGLEQNANKRIEMAQELFGGIFESRQINKSEVRKPVDDLNSAINRNHSEQYIIQTLTDSKNRQKIIRSLLSRLGADSKSAENYIVLGLTLHIHSQLYCCPNCQVALLGAQHNDCLKIEFIKDLKANGFKVKSSTVPNFPDELKMSVFVSAEDPYRNPKSVLPDKEVRFAEEDHHDIIIDLHSLLGTYIFAKDIKLIPPPCVAFFSNAKAKNGTMSESMKGKDDIINKQIEKEKEQEAEIKELKKQLSAKTCP